MSTGPLLQFEANEEPPTARYLLQVIPDVFAEKVQAVWGDRGRSWLETFDRTLAHACRQWKLSSVIPFADFSYNFVASARRGSGEPVVLKIGVPREELALEAESLKAYNGRGAVKLLAYDKDHGALLLEKLRGDSLWSTWTLANDDKNTEIAGHVMTKLWRPFVGTFPSLEMWFDALRTYLVKFDGDEPLPRMMVEHALGLASELNASSEQRMLLHGDLHHGNILSGWNEWKAIDPKGVIGDPAFEVSAWIRNPCDRILNAPNLKDVIDRRLHIVADITKLDIKRLRLWAYCGCVLSACWSVEDNEQFHESIACAKAIG